jgi:hypothetical protein
LRAACEALGFAPDLPQSANPYRRPMAQDRSTPDQMHYEALAQDALRGVVKAALKRAASPEGIPGAHHFYITFKTDAPGVSGPNDLLSKYPDEMTIVLQHQFWDLAPGETFFAVTLKFGGEPQRVSVPYSAVTRFYDPSVQFLLQFEPPAAAADKPATLPTAKVETLPVAAAQPGGEPRPEPDQATEGETKVVSLDQFRKK